MSMPAGSRACSTISHRCSRIFLDGLFGIALADGRYHENEEGFLRNVAEIFGIGERGFSCMEERHVSGRPRDPWQVLGVPRGTDLRDVRARWRELIRLNHPDKLIARGLPQETVALANARIAAINQAWEEISARDGGRRTAH